VLTTSLSREPAGTLRLAGDLDIETAPQLAACVEEQLRRGEIHLVLDLHELTFCDSRGIATLLAAASLCQNAGGSFRLIGATGTVSRVLTITGVGELLTQDAPFGPSFGSTAREAPRC
jgi:anti-anti-sigma factor